MKLPTQSKKPDVLTGTAIGARQISFPFSSEVTSRSFARSLETWIDSDAVPFDEQGSELALSIKSIRKSFEKLELRYITAKQEDPNCLPGVGLRDGAIVPELKAPGSKVRANLKEALGLSAHLDCCSPVLGKLQAALAEQHGLTPEEARVQLNGLLGDLISFRQNRPSLVRLSPQEVAEQQERLTEGETNE